MPLPEKPTKSAPSATLYLPISPLATSEVFVIDRSGSVCPFVRLVSSKDIRDASLHLPNIHPVLYVVVTRLIIN